MNKYFVRGAIAAALVAAPSAAFAQDAQVEPYVGATVGFHDLGADDIAGVVDDNGFIYGVVAGVDVPAGENFFVGLEGSFHLGEGAIDNEYGAVIRAGYAGDNGMKVYAKGGYHAVDIDVANLVNVAPNAIPAGIDDTADDYILGLGAQFGQGVKFRAEVDTVGFDSVRATAGVVFGF